MDWLDELLGKIQRRHSSLKSSLRWYIFLGFLGILTAYLLTASFCAGWQRMIHPTADHPENLWGVLFLANESASIFSTIQQWSLFFYILIAIIWISHVFYQRRIQQPLLILETEIKRLSEGDLSNPNHYQSGDEFETLFLAFDVMRQQLQYQQQQIVQLSQQQREVNAAFSHDLRTPLAVIQGHVNLLQKFYRDETIPKEKVADSLRTMNQHIVRLKNFSQTMQEIQSIDALIIRRQMVSREACVELFEELIRSFPKKNIQLEWGTPLPQQLSADVSVVAEVVENLLANAQVYAKQLVVMSVQVTEGYLICFVKDDGDGFSQEALFHGTEAYYSTNKSQHFGLGLTICQLLTRKHGGGLKLANSIEAGAIITATFSIL